MTKIRINIRGYYLPTYLVARSQVFEYARELYLFGQIQTSQTGGQPYSDTYIHYGEYSLALRYQMF